MQGFGAQWKPTGTGPFFRLCQVQEDIAEEIDIAAYRQTLIKDTEKLPLEVTLGSLISEDLDSLELTLVVAEEPRREHELQCEGAGLIQKSKVRELLLEAIQQRDEPRALQLLPYVKTSGLNQTDHLRGSLLNQALLHRGCQALALAIVARQDFNAINVKSMFGTALHDAVRHGDLQFCQAIVGRADFTELLAKDQDDNPSGMTALEKARAMELHQRGGEPWHNRGPVVFVGELHPADELGAIAALLEEAEARLPAARRHKKCTVQ